MKQVAVLGCGSWATAVARLIAQNIKDSSEFMNTVLMYVYNEKYDGESLADSINRLHVNSLYFPGFKLPENLVASTDLKDIVSRSDILAIAYPAKFVPWLMERVERYVLPTSYFISFSKGVVLDYDETCLRLVSDIIREKTGRPCLTVIGATTALEVAWQHYTEATIGSTDPELAEQTKRLLQTSYFRLVISPDAVGVELCGALKHVVAIAAGIADGLALGDNTKAAVLRLGFWEMFQLMKELFPDRGIQELTLEQSCGMAELFVCMSHRSDRPPALGSDMDLMNMLLGRQLTADRRNSVEDSSLSNAKIRTVCVNGSEYADMINKILQQRKRVAQYPLFTAVHLLCHHKMHPNQFIDRLRSHPVHQ
ncbi:hypothetical protein CRM22_009292 [Opisthorchis felineus]|uniref:Glycerol-3-phosphate dehydrogenase [NAD(+)] n=1 Tax=Opisthorchis felineus TaxID=147828 RepID=A0A4S2L7C2_OPIFE|nr:hypothetical protein CRM22_009292 [Opisthorchis felineus]